MALLKLHENIPGEKLTMVDHYSECLPWTMLTMFSLWSWTSGYPPVIHSRPTSKSIHDKFKDVVHNYWNWDFKWSPSFNKCTGIWISGWDLNKLLYAWVIISGLNFLFYKIADWNVCASWILIPIFLPAWHKLADLCFNSS